MYFVVLAEALMRVALIPSAMNALGIVWLAPPTLAHWKYWGSLLAIGLVVLNHLLAQLLTNPPRFLPIVPVFGWMAIIALVVGVFVKIYGSAAPLDALVVRVWSGLAIIYAVLVLLTWGR